MLKTRKIAITLLLAVALFSIFPSSLAASPTDIAAKSALLVEVTSGKVLYESNKDELRPPDSLSKLLTVFIAADMCSQGLADPEALITMTQSALFDITSSSPTQNIVPGEELSLYDLMYCAFLGSANEACNLIAEHLGGSVSGFIAIMNEYAKNLGCTDTFYTNTHGQYDSNQYTTAHDQYLIYREALNNPMFSEIAGTYRYTVGQTNTSAARKLTSPNHMLNPDSRYYYRFCTGGRPSATYEGGYSHIASAENGGSALISVILGSDAVVMEDQSTLMRNLSETKRLFEWGFSEFGWRTILAESELVAKAPVTYGDGVDYVNLRPQSSIRLFAETSIDNAEFVRDVTVYSVENNERLFAPIDAGAVLGEITVTRGGVNYGTVKLVANTFVDLHRVEYIKSQIRSILSSAAARTIIAVLLVLLVVYIALVVRYNKRRREHLRRVAEAKAKLADERRNTYKK